MYDATKQEEAGRKPGCRLESLPHSAALYYYILICSRCAKIFATKQEEAGQKPGCRLESLPHSVAMWGRASALQPGFCPARRSIENQ